MKKYQITFCFIATSGLFFYSEFLASTVGSEELTAQAIMQKAQSAMHRSLSYSLETGEVQMQVFQAAMPDGSLSFLTSISSPTQLTSIFHAGQSYDLFLTPRKAVDKSFLLDDAKNLLDSIQSNVKIAKESRYKFLEPPKRVGAEFYCIAVVIPEETIESLADIPNLSEVSTAIPAETHYFIDKSTYFFSDVESYSRDGSLISKSTYKNFEEQPTLSKDFFAIPNGFTVLTPKSMDEYLVCMQLCMQEVFPTRSPVLDLNSSVLLSQWPRYETNTKRATIESSISNDQGGYSEKALSPWGRIFNMRMIAFLVSNVLIVVLVIIFLRFSKRSKQT